MPSRRLSLGLTKKSAMRRIEALCKTAFPLGWNLDSGLHAGEGFTRDHLDAPGVARIGVSEIEDSFLFVDDIDFVSVVACIGHEQRHMDVRGGVIAGTVSPDLAANYLARHGNPCYYQKDGAYGHNLTEIDAEFSGIMFAYEYLRSEFSEEIADAQIRAYVDSRRGNSLYSLVDLKRTLTIDAICDAFDEARDKAGEQCDIYRRSDEDELSAYLGSHGDANELFAHTERKADRDKLVAAIVLDIHPEYREICKDNAYVQELDIKAVLREYSAAKAGAENLAAVSSIAAGLADGPDTGTEEDVSDSYG